MIATARAAMRGTQFLIFDEPTAYLTRQETAQLFALIRRLKAEGVTIVYISHRMEEVFELADRVSVLRDGDARRHARASARPNESELIALMINRSIEQIYHKDTHRARRARCSRPGTSRGKGFEDVSLTVREGEIVGLYGLIGAGRSEFVMGLFGRHPNTSGEILWNGKPVKIRNERDAIDLGIALAPESRRDQGLCLNLGVGLNLNLPIYRAADQRRDRSSARAERERADQQIATCASRRRAATRWH